MKEIQCYGYTSHEMKLYVNIAHRSARGTILVVIRYNNNPTLTFGLVLTEEVHFANLVGV